MKNSLKTFSKIVFYTAYGAVILKLLTTSAWLSSHANDFSVVAGVTVFIAAIWIALKFSSDLVAEFRKTLKEKIE